MKKLNIALSLVFALSMAVMAIGCGKKDDSASNPQPVAVVNGAPSVPTQPLPPNPNGLSTNTLPAGCYYSPSTPNTCAPCPQGYTQSGNFCAFNGQAVNGCTAGSFWNGYYCQPIGSYYYSTGCPWGTTWSYQYYGCVAYQGYSPSCKYKSYLGGMVNTYVCY